MSLVAHALILLLATALSIPVARLFRMPLALLQIVLGVGLWASGVDVRLDPEIFMLLFVPPLLFADAARIPQRDFLELRRVILALAVGLVVFTTLAGGLAVQALLPALPLAACMTLAAILSPTDTVAVTGLIGENAPRRIVHVLEGEALLNDASGLVCFKFAAAATMTGAFSPSSALLDFGMLATIGVAVGTGVAVVFGLLDRSLIRMGIDDVVTQTTLTMLLPFAVYLLADALGGSGILAAVAAGLALGRLRLLGETRGVVRLQMRSLWRAVVAIFNGLIFLLLGAQLPGIARSGASAGLAAGMSIWGLLGTVAAIATALILLRLAWVVSVVLAGIAYRKARRRPAGWPGFAALSAVALGGVRGAVTLAGILSLPVAASGSPGFPDRDLLIGLAAGVIIASLLVATILLPLVMGRVSASSLHPLTADTGRVRALLTKAAIAGLRRTLEPDGQSKTDGGPRAEVIAQLLAEQTRRLEDLSSEGGDRNLALDRNRVEAAARLGMLRTQRDELRRLTDAGDVADEVETVITEALDREEVALAGLAANLPRDFPTA